jgi:hypothetical protein
VVLDSTRENLRFIPAFLPVGISLARLVEAAAKGEKQVPGSREPDACSDGGIIKEESENLNRRYPERRISTMLRIL